MGILFLHLISIILAILDLADFLFPLILISHLSLVSPLASVFAL